MADSTCPSCGVPYDEVQRLRRALESIKQHIEIMGAAAGQFSTAYRIAKYALEGSEVANG